MEELTNLLIKPVVRENWAEFEALFQSKGILRNCWCMAWRTTKEESKKNNPECRKEYMKHRIWSGTPVGLLAYDGDQAIGWCSVAPRETYQRLAGDETLEDVWSIACFYVKNEYRDKGLIYALIDGAKKYAGRNGAKYLEAYPVEPDSPSYRFMGFVKTFEKASFTFVKKAGTRRNVMIYKL